MALLLPSETDSALLRREPPNPESALQRVQSICDKLGIPYFDLQERIDVAMVFDNNQLSLLKGLDVSLPWAAKKVDRFVPQSNLVYITSPNELPSLRTDTQGNVVRSVISISTSMVDVLDLTLAAAELATTTGSVVKIVGDVALDNYAFSIKDQILNSAYKGLINPQAKTELMGIDVLNILSQIREANPEKYGQSLELYYASQMSDGLIRAYMNPVERNMLDSLIYLPDKDASKMAHKLYALA